MNFASLNDSSGFDWTGLVNNISKIAQPILSTALTYQTTKMQTDLAKKQAEYAAQAQIANMQLQPGAGDMFNLGYGGTGGTLPINPNLMTPPRQQTNYVPWIIGGIVLLGGAIVIMRSR